MLNNSSTYHDFILDCQYSFYFFHDAAFCSFTFCISPNFLSLSRPFVVRCTEFAFLCFLKWGETFELPRCFAKPVRFRFVFTAYFYFTPRRIIFCCFTIFLVSPRCHLLKRHDIYDCTAMPSFVASRYLWLHRDAIFCCATIFMIAPRCLSFETPRYFTSLPRTLF